LIFISKRWSTAGGKVERGDSLDEPDCLVGCRAGTQASCYFSRRT
jgi:hypothetical protein